jgi:hypothetical protein
MEDAAQLSALLLVACGSFGAECSQGRPDSHSVSVWRVSDRSPGAVAAAASHELCGSGSGRQASQTTFSPIASLRPNDRFLQHMFPSALLIFSRYRIVHIV